MNTMNGRLAAIARDQRGVFTRAQALDCGYDDERLRRAVRDGRWLRIRRGAYVERASYVELDEVGRHLVRVHAVGLQLTGPVAVSHGSAALLHGIPTWGVDLSRVHVTRVRTGTGRIEGDVAHHAGELPDEDVVVVEGLPVVRPARAVLEMAMTEDFESGVVTADAALHLGIVTSDELHEMLERSRSWPGVRTAGAVVAFADGRSESVGESRARVLFHNERLPPPVLQHCIYDRDGRLVGRVDFYFPETRTVVEFDGEVKYAGGDPGVLYREKVREDEIRELDYGFARMVWPDLDRSAATAARVRRAMRRGAVAVHT